MKLFMIIYMNAHIAATIGPLPYDMSECLRRRFAPFSSTFVPSDLDIIHNGIRRVIKGKTVTLMCEDRAARPRIYNFDGSRVENLD